MSAVMDTATFDPLAHGLHVFPLRRNGKTPATEGWQGQATTDPERTSKWASPGRNWGVRTGTTRANPTTGAAERLVVIDLDRKKGADGPAMLKTACTAAGFELDGLRTLIVQTPSGGGLHLYFWSSAPIRQGAHVLGPGSGVDVRAAGGYVVGPGSTIDGTAYRVVMDAPIATMPSELAALFPRGDAEMKPADTTPLPGVDPVRARTRAVEYLKTAPAAVQGEAGDTTTYRVAAMLKDKGCTQAQALELMAAHWNSRAAPPWDDDELETKVRNAFKHGKDAPGIAAPEAVFDRVEMPAEDAQPKRAGLVVTCVADVASKPIEWLWPQVFALGKHSTIAGDPGLGKSQVSICLAALVSTGGVLPDGSPCPLGDVVFITAEDDVADTIRPRLEAARADLRRIHVIDGVPATTPTGQEGVRGFDITSDVHRLAELLDTLPEARLIVIDPMSAFLGGTDSHKAAEVRAAMGAISKLAETRRVALLSINHLNKSSGASAMARVSGSGAFVAQPRAAYIVTRDKDDQALRVMAPLKNNIGDDTTAYFFKVVSVTVDGGIETSRVEWQERTEQLSADEALEQKAPKGAGAESLRAMDYIRATLAAGAKPAREMEAGAKTAGISAATLRRAREALRVMSGKEHGKRDGQWVWALPDPPRTAEDIFK
jgi:putative DNA primase/helicase